MFSALLSIEGALVLSCIIVKYRYEGIALTPEALPVYTSVVLTSWILLPLSATYTVLGTICAIPEPETLGTTWNDKLGRLLTGPLFMNMLNTLGPLAWIAITTVYAAKTTVHFNNAYSAAKFLHHQLDQESLASSLATAAQYAAAEGAWNEFLAGFNCIRIIAILWAFNVTVIAFSVLLVGGRICRILCRQLREWKNCSQAKHTPDQVVEKLRSLRESIAILGSFYVLLSVSGTILIVIMGLTAARLSKGVVAESLDAFRVCQLVLMWTVAVNGTVLMVLFSGRVFAAASVGAIDKRPIPTGIFRRRGAAPGVEGGDGAAEEEKRGWADTALQRTSGILNIAKVGRGKASLPYASMTTSGIQMDVDEEMVMDEADLDAVSGSTTANSTPMSRLSKLPSASPSIAKSPLAISIEEEQAIPPWER